MKTFIALFSISICTVSFAQDRMFSSEGNSTFHNNPASFGNQEKWSVNTFGQVQMMDHSGTEDSYNFNGGGAIPVSKDGKHQLIAGATYSYGRSYFVNDETARLAIGYRLKWTDDMSAAIAVGPGFSDLRYNLYIPMVSGTGDELYFIQKNSARDFDISIGGMFNWKTFYAGASVSQLNRPTVGIVPVELPTTTNFHAGYKIPLKEHAIFPMAQLQNTGGFHQYQIMTNYVFKNDLFSTGVGYHSTGSLLVGASVALKGFRIGYNLMTVSRGTKTPRHEFRLSYSM